MKIFSRREEITQLNSECLPLYVSYKDALAMAQRYQVHTDDLMTVERVEGGFVVTQGLRE